MSLKSKTLIKNIFNLWVMVPHGSDQKFGIFIFMKIKWSLNNTLDMECTSYTDVMVVMQTWCFNIIFVECWWTGLEEFPNSVSKNSWVHNSYLLGHYSTVIEIVWEVSLGISINLTVRYSKIVTRKEMKWNYIKASIAFAL